jgi:hypothetical protein
MMDDDKLPDQVKRSLERHGAGLNAEDAEILDWSTVSPTGRSKDSYFTVITRSRSSPMVHNEYMPHEVTTVTVTRLSVFEIGGRMLLSNIISQDRETYVDGTPNKIKEARS